MSPPPRCGAAARTCRPARRACLPSLLQMYLTFLEYKLADPNNCRSNFVDILAEEPQHESLSHFCGTMAEPTQSKSNHVKVRYYAEHGALKGGNFSILFTAFREISTGGERRGRPGKCLHERDAATTRRQHH